MNREDLQAFLQLPVDTLQSQNLSEPARCLGNQHTCRPKMFIPQLDRRFDLVLTGTGDSVAVGHHLGPRALIWKNTELEGSHPDLGKVTVRLDPNVDHAGVLVPLDAGNAFPALNRNTYFFVFNIEHVGELISDRPAIVEAMIDQIPPTATYQFTNAPLNLYLRTDSTRTTVAVLEAASTDVQPAEAPPPSAIPF
jgi:hypothetical protein